MISDDDDNVLVKNVDDDNGLVDNDDVDEDDQIDADDETTKRFSACHSIKEGRQGLKVASDGIPGMTW